MEIITLTLEKYLGLQCIEDEEIKYILMFKESLTSHNVFNVEVIRVIHEHATYETNKGIVFHVMI